VLRDFRALRQAGVNERVAQKDGSIIPHQCIQRLLGIAQAVGKLVRPYRVGWIRRNHREHGLQRGVARRHVIGNAQVKRLRRGVRAVHRRRPALAGKMPDQQRGCHDDSNAGQQNSSVQAHTVINHIFTISPVAIC
jgi:hypothetical protein